MMCELIGCGRVCGKGGVAAGQFEQVCCCEV